MAVGQELLRAALGYGVKRVEELRASALTDAVAFATALGVPGFGDGDGAVAARLTAAKLRVDQAAAALGGGNLVATADHLAGAFVELEAAAAKVGRPLDAALATSIGWANANPQGLVRQLGLPAIPPSIAVRDGALEYGLGAPGKRLAATPVLGFDAITLTARLRIDGQRPTFAVSVEIDGAEVGVGGGPIASLLGNAASSVSSDLVVGFDTDHELTLSGTTAPRVVLPARTKVGPVDLREIAIELPPGTPDTFDVSGSIVVDLGGVITATVDGAGIRATVDPTRVASGGDAVTIGLKAPTGVGLALDTGLVRGGGFLGVRPDGGFGGALQLRLGPIEVKAVGLLHLDPFALVVVMSIEFIPAIDLSFGFTLNAVGGVHRHRAPPRHRRAARPAQRRRARPHHVPGRPRRRRPGDPRHAHRGVPDGVGIHRHRTDGRGRVGSPDQLPHRPGRRDPQPPRPEDRRSSVGSASRCRRRSCRSSTCAPRCTARSRPTTC